MNRSNELSKQIANEGFEFHQRFRGRSGQCYFIASKRFASDFGRRKGRWFVALTDNLWNDEGIEFKFVITGTALATSRVKDLVGDPEQFLLEAGLSKFKKLLLENDSIGVSHEMMLHSKSPKEDFILHDPEQLRRDIKRAQFELLNLLWEHKYRGIKRTEKEEIRDHLCTDELILDSVLRSYEQKRFIKGGLSSGGTKITPEGEDELEKLRIMVPEYDAGSLETKDRDEMDKKQYDVFVCHAYEDKEGFVRGLAEGLRNEKLRVWYDDFSLQIGNSLRESIDKGLSKSRYGIVVLSKHFFKKQWPQKELNALFTKMEPGKDIILPVWHEISAEEIRQYSPLLADIFGAKSSEGLENVITKIVEVVKS